MGKHIYSCVFLIAVSFSPAFSQWKLNSSIHFSVLTGIDFILKQEYQRADSVFYGLAERNPSHPAGYFYQAAVLQARAVDFDIPIDRVKFDSLIERGRMAAHELAFPWREYFLATADGYEAYERVERGDWLGGVRKGMSSASKYEEALDNDSTFYDAYVGIGTYYYWRSRKTSFLHWLPFVKDDREIGIKLLVVGANKSEYNQFTAISALVSIFLDAEDYIKAEHWALKGLMNYPENRVFLWGLATALDRQKRFSESIPAYENLLANILKIKFPHPYSEIVCRLNLVKCKLAVNDSSNVVSHLEKIISHEEFSFPYGLITRAKTKFIEARKLHFSFLNKAK